MRIAETRDSALLDGRRTWVPKHTPPTDDACRQMFPFPELFSIGIPDATVSTHDEQAAAVSGERMQALRRRRITTVICYICSGGLVSESMITECLSLPC
jgi:hypothetical protein